MRRALSSLLLAACVATPPPDGDPDGAPDDEQLPVIPASIPPCDFPDRGALNLWLVAFGVTPLGDVMTPQPDWVPYSDPDIPLFSFYYPPQYTAVNLDDGVFVGFQLLSSDQLVQQKFGSVLTVAPDLTSQQVVDVERGALLGDSFAVRCTSTDRSVDAVGTDATVAVIEAQGAIFVIGASVYFDPDGRFGYAADASMNAAIRWMAAPRDQFTARTDDLFLPVLYQFYGGGGDDDSDGDGVPDVNDAFPNDPDQA